MFWRVFYSFIVTLNWRRKHHGEGAERFQQVQNTSQCLKFSSALKLGAFGISYTWRYSYSANAGCLRLEMDNAIRYWMPRPTLSFTFIMNEIENCLQPQHSISWFTNTHQMILTVFLVQFVSSTKLTNTRSSRYKPSNCMQVRCRVAKSL